MNRTSDYFISRDGLRIFYRSWEVDNSKKIVCIVHGLGEHSGRYDHIAQELCNASIAVFALDLRGHGKSEGKKGHAKSLDILMEDIEELMKTARVKYIDIPMILFGHSMGGNLVANLITKKPTKEIAGFVLSAPWFKLAFQPPKWKLTLGKWMSNMIPSLTQTNNLDTSLLSKDQKEVEKYIQDPLVHGLISAGLFSIILNSGIELLKDKKITTQGLCYHGLSDKVIDYQTSKRFALENGLKWIGYDNVYHEPHNDLEKGDVIKHLTEWIAQVD